MFLSNSFEFYAFISFTERYNQNNIVVDVITSNLLVLRKSLSFNIIITYFGEYVILKQILGNIKWNWFSNMATIHTNRL